VTNPNGVLLNVTVNVSVQVSADAGLVNKLISVSQPQSVTKDYGAAKTAAGLGLPTTVTITTSQNPMGISADVTWNVGYCAYDPGIGAEQSFNVRGTVTLPVDVFNPDNLSLTVYAEVTVQQSSTTYLLTVGSGTGGTVSGTTSGNYPTGTAVNVLAIPTTGYSFTGWTVSGVPITGGNTANPATFYMPANAVSVTANWTSTGGGGGGGTTPAAQTIPAGDGTVSVSYTLSGGIATLDIPASKITDIISKAKNVTAILDLSKVSGAISATFPKTALTQLASAGLAVEIKLPQGTVMLDTGAARDIATQAGGTNVTVSINAINQSALTVAQRAAINPGDLVFNISAMSGTQAITNFSGTITVTVPYDGALPAAVWYLDSAGNLTKLESIYNPVTKTISFTTDHLSLYVVGQDSSNPNTGAGIPFEDVKASDWFLNSIIWAYENGLMIGTNTSPMLFSPNIATTRGMIVTILYRMDGNPDVSGLPNPFDDVAADKYYTDAVKWAAANGIVSGYGNGKYGPEDNITREQLVTILNNYASNKGLPLRETRDYPGFNDDRDIANYAKEAIERFFRTEIINGKTGNVFDPKGSATRAEVATMLMNFVEATDAE
jgi:hypothetical protein